MPEDEYVGILIGGLRAGYNVLTNSWALDEVRGDAENGGPATLDELSSALRKFESNRSFKATQVIWCGSGTGSLVLVSSSLEQRKPTLTAVLFQAF